MTLNMGLTYLSSPDEKYIKYWLNAGVLFALSNIVALCLNIFAPEKAISPVIANASFYAAHAAILNGVYVYLYTRPIPLLVSSIFILSVALHAVPEVANSVEVRFFVFSPIIILLDLFSSFLLFKNLYRKDSHSFWPLLITLTIFATLMTIRLFAIAISDERLSLFGNDYLQTAGSFVIIAFIFLLTIGFNYIVTWKKELALRDSMLTDYLTGWSNRRGLAIKADKEFSRFKRLSHPLGICVFDIDHFKFLNDTYGHLSGDLALKAVTSCVAEEVRDYDFCCRFGGEEFVLLLPNIDSVSLKNTTERIRSAVNNLAIKGNDHTMSVTVSIGGTIANKYDRNWEETLKRADKNLYNAKQTGRNKVVIDK
ncbi:GGDEF domain-containing protein [Alteromonas sp. KUL150]|uniref:GGDEF domain-containing protein n=1 Tax=Alteromonas sp. KUL150 TaxID=2480805 RepID=UPI0013309BE1|nr:GGDEF domain-containing protein [Alteromonas sp. KUL150]